MRTDEEIKEEVFKIGSRCEEGPNLGLRDWLAEAVVFRLGDNPEKLVGYKHVIAVTADGSGIRYVADVAMKNPRPW